MVANIQYPPRTFDIPSGFSILPIQNDAYNNAIINNLYPQFACCYAHQINQVIQNRKKGILCNFSEQSMYLLMSLYVLRNWYNGGFTIPVPSGASSSYSATLYWSANNTEVPTVSFVTATSSSYLGLVQALQNALPLGYTVVSSTTPTSIYIQTVNQQQPYVYYSVSALSTVTGFAALDLVPCIPYSAIQQIIQNCMKICGCANCTTVSALEKDNVYTSLGLIPPVVLGGVTQYTDNTYFN